MQANKYCPWTYISYEEILSRSLVVRSRKRVVDNHALLDLAALDPAARGYGLGQAAASPKAQIVWPSISLVNSKIMSISFSVA